MARNWLGRRYHVRGSSLCHAESEWIHYRGLVKLHSVLQLFGKQNRASLGLGCGDNHRIPPAHLVSPLDLMRADQQVSIDLPRLPREEGNNVLPGFFAAEAGLKFSRNSRVELAQHLCTRASTLLEPKLVNPL
jgi:hypothetical protein